MVVFLFLLVATGVGLWYGRWYLMIHFPEQYEEVHRAEKNFAKVSVAATERAVRGLVAAIKGMGRLLGSRKA
jgi:hypothetical protein